MTNIKKNNFPELFLGLKIELIIYSFLASIFSYLTAYGFELTHFTLSIDEDYFNNFHHTVELGRWGHAFLKIFLFPEPYVPFVTMVTTIMLTSLSVSIIAPLLFEDKLRCIAFSIIYAAIPAFAYQFQFQNQADTLSLSFILSALMAVIFDKKTVWRSVIFIFMGVLVMSIYQSIILLPIGIIMAKELVNSTQEDFNFSKSIKKIAFLFACSVLIYVFYSITTKLIQSYLSIPSSSYLSDMASWGKSPFTDVFSGIIRHLWDRVSGHSHYGLNIYKILLIPLIWIVIRNIAMKQLYTVALAVVIFIFPFTLEILTGSWLPARTLTQMPLCFAVLMVFAFPVRFSRVLILVAMIILFSCSVKTNKLFYADYVTNKQDDLLSSMMISTLIERYPDFSAAKDNVYFYGNGPLFNPWKPASSENFGMSFFQYGDSRINQYLNMTGFMDLKRVSPEIINKNKSKIESANCWPMKNSIVKFNNNYIIKYCPESFK